MSTWKVDRVSSSEKGPKDSCAAADMRAKKVNKRSWEFQ